MTIVYGPPAIGDRHKLWDFKDQVHESLIGSGDMPWMLIGDFNQVLN